MKNAIKRTPKKLRRAYRVWRMYTFHLNLLFHHINEEKENDEKAIVAKMGKKPI